MLSGKKNKGLIILLSLLVATTVNATPTVNTCNEKFTAQALVPSEDAHIISVFKTSQINNSYHLHPFDISDEFLNLPAGLIGSPPDQSINVKSLPAVPGAFLMALIGFLFVSLYKEQKHWLAALAILLWLVQSGFVTLLHMSSHMAGNKHMIQQFIPGQEYHLYDKTFSYYHKNTYTPQSAIILERDNLNPLFNCMALRAERTCCFSSAFTFAYSARGPPELA